MAWFIKKWPWAKIKPKIIKIGLKKIHGLVYYKKVGGVRG